MRVGGVGCADSSFQPDWRRLKLQSCWSLCLLSCLPRVCREASFASAETWNRIFRLFSSYRRTSCLLRQPLDLRSSLFCNRRSDSVLLSAEAAESTPRANVAVCHHHLIPLSWILQASQKKSIIKQQQQQTSSVETGNNKFCPFFRFSTGKLTNEMMDQSRWGWIFQLVEKQV